MNFTVFVTENAIQFNLELESDREKELLSLLEKYKGDVSVFRGVNISESRGGFLRDYGERNNIISIKINRITE